MLSLATKGYLSGSLGLITKGVIFVSGVIVVIERKKLMKEGWMKVGRWKLGRGY